jgi:hypothetical protein
VLQLRVWLRIGCGCASAAAAFLLQLRLRLWLRCGFCCASAAQRRDCASAVAAPAASSGCKRPASAPKRLPLQCPRTSGRSRIMRAPLPRMHASDLTGASCHARFYGGCCGASAATASATKAGWTDHQRMPILPCTISDVCLHPPEDSAYSLLLGVCLSSTMPNAYVHPKSVRRCRTTGCNDERMSKPVFLVRGVRYASRLQTAVFLVHGATYAAASAAPPGS